MVKTHGTSKNVNEKCTSSSKNVKQTTQSPALSKRPPIHGKNEASNQKRGMKDTGKIPAAPKSPNVKENGEENGKTWMYGRMAYVFGNFPFQGSQNTFFKNGSLPNSNFFSHTLPIPCNN